MPTCFPVVHPPQARHHPAPVARPAHQVRPNHLQQRQQRQLQQQQPLQLQLHVTGATVQWTSYWIHPIKRLIPLNHQDTQASMHTTKIADGILR